MLGSSAAGQCSGFLLKKPIGHPSKTWQRRFFVVKDGFLLYYDENEKKVFDKKKFIGLHPKGIMPLGECSISVAEECGQPFIIVINNDATEERLCVATETEVEQLQWLDILNKSTRINWKNAQLGDALIQQLQMHGSRLAEERQDIYKKLHVEVRSLSEEKQRSEELERVNEELEAEKRRIEAMSAELNEQYVMVKDELQMTAGALSAVEREREALKAASQALEQQLEALAQAKEETSRTSLSPRLLPTFTFRPIVDCSPTSEAELPTLADAQQALHLDKESRLRVIEEEMKKIQLEKAEAEQKVLEKEELTRLLEDEKLMYSFEAQCLRENLEAIANEKASAESELRDQVRFRLAAEDRLRAAEQAVRDLEKKLGAVKSSGEEQDLPGGKHGGIKSEEASILTEEQKEQMRMSVKSLQVYFNHIIAEHSIEASRPIIMKNSVSLRRRGVRAKSMHVAPTCAATDVGTLEALTVLSPETCSTVKLRRAATLLLRDPTLRKTAVDFMSSQESLSLTMTQAGSLCSS